MLAGSYTYMFCVSKAVRVNWTLNPKNKSTAEDVGSDIFHTDGHSIEKQAAWAPSVWGYVLLRACSAAAEQYGNSDTT